MNILRIMKLIKNDLLMQSKTILMAGIATAVLFLFFNTNDIKGMYVPFLHLIGLTITGYAFSDVHDKKRGYRYLLLPASSFEKFFSRWFSTSMLYLLSFSVLLYALGFLAPYEIWQAIPGYLILQSVFLLGAIYFKKNVLLKTGLLISLPVVLVPVILIFISLVNFNWIILMVTNDLSSFASFSAGTNWGIYYFSKLFLAPICLLIGYIRFKECEI